LLLSAAESDDAQASKLTKKDIVQLLRTKQFDELDRIAAQSSRSKPTLLTGYALHKMLDYLHTPISTGTGGDAWAEHIQLLENWANHSSNSVHPRIALGRAYVSWAWSARGSEYTDQVTKEGWEMFAQRLNKADNVLADAEKISIERPELYSVWLTAAYGLNLPQKRIDEIFEKGRTAGRDFVHLYFVKSRFLLPRWCGKPGDWEKFAKQMADERGGSEGDLLYLLIARNQAWTEGDDFFKNTRTSFARMKKGFEVKLNSATDEIGELNSYCYFACIAGDRATARSLFQRIGSKWRQAQWKNEGRFQKWKNWAEGNASSN
jgi:Domain of unknown function (DUF4034)